MWELWLNPSTLADAFVACGVLHGVEADGEGGMRVA